MLNLHFSLKFFLHSVRTYFGKKQETQFVPNNNSSIMSTTAQNPGMSKILDEGMQTHTEDKECATGLAA